MCSRGGGMLAAMLCGLAILTYLRGGETSTILQAPPPPPARLRFGVRVRRRQRRRSAPAGKDRPEASQRVAMPSVDLLPSSQQQSASALACNIQGSATGAGCNGHSCLLGACFCSGESGGDHCERGSRGRRSCAAEAQAAYSPDATAVTRHAAHDKCAFYEPAYGILRVECACHSKRVRASQPSDLGRKHPS